MSAEPAITISAESPDQPDIRVLLGELDSYLTALYEPEHNHILDVQALLAQHVFFVVARRERAAVGCAALRVVPGEPATLGQPYGEIKRMYVRPELRGQGIARALLARLEARLTGRGIHLALLETGGRQGEALRLYERCGYVKRAPFGGYEDNGTSVFYAKHLASNSG
ncbi:MAG: GNAT family N-acetyltransferase [Burkholderiaceae bacterium]